METQVQRARRLMPIVATLFVCILAVAVIVLGRWHYLNQRERVERQVEEELTAISVLKIDQVIRWRKDRLAEAEHLSKSPTILGQFELWLDNPLPEYEQSVMERLTSFGDRPEFHGLVIFDADGNQVLGTGRFDGILPEPVLRAIDEVLRTRTPTLTQLHAAPDDHSPHLDAVAPFVNAQGDLLGGVVFHIDPEEYLYPLVQSWPVPSDTAETALVAQDGEDALFLNDLRHASDAALSHRIPLSETGSVAVRVVLGEEGLVRGFDYRGVPVVAVLSKVPDSPWFFVSKVDEAEAFAEWHVERGLLLLLAMGILLGSGGTVALVWEHDHSAQLQSLLVAQRARLESEGRYGATLMSVGDGVIATDADCAVVLINPVAEELTGWSQAEAAGRSLDEVFRVVNEHTREPAESPACEVLRDGAIVGLANHTVLIARDGTERPIADSGAPVRDADGTVIGVVVVFRDQTEERAAREELAAMNRSLESIVAERTEKLRAANEELEATSCELMRSNAELVEAGAAKSRFLRSMSHELRTPLNSIIGFAGVMLQGFAGEVEAEQRRQLEMIDNAGHHLLALINDILDLSRIEAGRIDIEMESVDVVALVQNIIDSVREAANAKEIALHMEVCDEPLHLVSDTRKIRQILTNLLGNAVKFTDEGDVTVSIHRLAQAMIAFSVTDTGPGVAEDEQELVFGEFAQVETASDTEREGTGLGLAISRGLAAALGGTLTLESTPGEGSTFTLLLPESPSDV